MPQDPVITFLLVNSSCTTTALQQARMGLLDDDCQVHPLVNRTVDVVGPCRTKWPNLNAVAIDLHVIDSGCARLARWFGGAILPGAIRKDMEH